MFGKVPLNKTIDHTMLKPFAREQDIKKLCQQAREYDFASVCINPCHVALAKSLLEGSTVNVCTVIGFPLGANTTATKVAETRDALAAGCQEFDMVINVGALKDEHYDFVRQDIAAVVEAAQGHIVKVIIETSMLTDEEKVMACHLAAEAGASFVKTCTGFNDGVATVEDIILMGSSVPSSVRVKASSGIRDYAAAKALLDAGAQRLGTSAGVAIVTQAPAGSSEDTY
jgi:deoxyribose-phosphate aldolase